MTTVYHEISPSLLRKVLHEGLKRSHRGDKGDEPDIIKTDELLDYWLPQRLRQKGVSRSNNIYAYLEVGGKVSNIQDGRLVEVVEFIKTRKQKVLKLHVDAKRCFVSDLDAYDRVKDAMKHHSKGAGVQQLAIDYWNQLTSFDTYKSGTISRPEVMITYTIDPKDIELIGM